MTPCSRCGNPSGVVGPGPGVQVLCGDCSPTTSLIGGPGWQKGVLDCIDTLFVRQINGQADFSEAIKLLQALYARDAKST